MSTDLMILMLVTPVDLADDAVRCVPVIMREVRPRMGVVMFRTNWSVFAVLLYCFASILPEPPESS